MSGAAKKPSLADAASSVDAALLTLRRDAGPLLAFWLLAWTPQAAAAWWLIDAVAARDEPAIGARALAFTLALPWRWAVMGLLQARVMRRRGAAVATGRARARALAGVVRTRALAAAVAQLGFVLVLPGVWMTFVAAFAGPRALRVDEEGDPDRPAREAGFLRLTAFVVGETRPLVRHALLVSSMLLIGTAAAAASFVVGLYLLQAWLNVELATGALVWSTPVALLALGLGVWAVGDLVASLSAVPLLEGLGARRGGGDLRRRLEAAAAAAERSDEELERAA